jgi:hypothetical protein
MTNQGDTDAPSLKEAFLRRVRAVEEQQNNVIALNKLREALGHLARCDYVAVIRTMRQINAILNPGG